MKTFRKLAAFLKAYWATKMRVNVDKLADALGKPKTLELTKKQARLVQDLFCLPDSDPMKVLKGFYNAYPRTDFKYFMSVSADGLSLEWADADTLFEGLEIIDAAMRTLGAKYQHKTKRGKPRGDWYYDLNHPMVKRMGQAYNSQDVDEIAKTRKRGGAVDALVPELAQLEAEAKARHDEWHKLHPNMVPNVSIGGT